MYVIHIRHETEREWDHAFMMNCDKRPKAKEIWKTFKNLFGLTKENRNFSCRQPTAFPYIIY